jgi:creatinine amidohydrolase
MKRPHPPYDCTDIRWPDVAADEAARWVAVLPLAATEQHGPHLPFETDTLIAEAYLSGVRQRLSDDVPATFLPVQRVGISTEHLGYPGTLTLSPEAALRDWMAIGDGIAEKGLRRLVIVTSHGGNSAAMTIVAQELRAKHAMLVATTAWGRLSEADRHFPPDEMTHGVHGGAVETSIMLARYPQRVRGEAIANFVSSGVGMATEFKRLSTQRPAPMAWMAQDLNPAGAVGDATLATAATGEALLATGAQAFCELLDDMARFDLARLANRPLPR